MALLAWALLWAMTIRAEALEAPKTRIVHRVLLEADGPLNRVTAQDCLRLIAVQEGRRYDASSVRHSIDRLYSTGVFYDIRVKTRPADGDTLDVVFQLFRLNLVKQVDFSGQVALDQRELRREYLLRAGLPFHQEQAQEGIDDLKRLYRRHGYYQARIEPHYKLDSDHAEISIELETQAGQQARIRSYELDVRGPLTPPEVRRLLEISHGGRYSRAQIEDHLREIRDTLVLQGYLEAQASIPPDGESVSLEENVVDLRIVVRGGPGPLVRLENADLPRRELLGLPVFTFGSSGRGLAEETREELIRLHQEQGYFQADVVVQGSAQNGEVPDVPLVFRVEKGEKVDLKSIAFEGCRQVDCEPIRERLQSRVAGIFSPGHYTRRIVERDRDTIRNLLRDQGFQQVQVEHRLESLPGGGLELAFVVDEGDRSYIGQVSLSGNNAIADSDLVPMLQSAPEKAFSPFTAAADRNRILAAYSDRGYREAECRVEAAFPDAGRVDLNFSIEEGRRTFVGEVVVVGDLVTAPAVIARELRVKPGGPLSAGDLLATESNLHDLSVFSRVQVESVEESESPESETVVVTLEEAPQYTFVYGLGFSSFEGLRGTIGITDGNFRGRAQTLTASARASNIRQRASISLTTPRLGPYKLPTVFSLTARNEEARRTRDGLTRNVDGRPFDELRLSIEGRTERILSQRESVFVGFRFERVEVTPLPDLDTTLSFFRVEESLRLSSLTLSYANESRDLAVNPTSGFFLSGDAAISTGFLGSEEEFFRLLVQGQYYRPLPWRVVFASSMRVGWIRPFGSTNTPGPDNPVPVSERFFSGGSTSLRGLPQDLAGPLLRDPLTGEVVLVNDDGQRDVNGRAVPEGGNALLIGNLELRRPLWRFVSGTAFYDVGNVFRDFSSLSFSDLSHTLGVGLRFNTPIGPFRLDAGYNPAPPSVRGFNHWNFHITLGHAF